MGDQAIISVPVGHREAFEVFYLGDESSGQTYVAFFMSWDATGGISTEKEIAAGDARTVMLAVAEAIRTYEAAEREMEVSFTPTNEQRAAYQWALRHYPISITKRAAYWRATAETKRLQGMASRATRLEQAAAHADRINEKGGE